MIITHVLLPIGEGYQRETVSYRMRGVYGNQIGERDYNILIDTYVYE